MYVFCVVVILLCSVILSKGFARTEESHDKKRYAYSTAVLRLGGFLRSFHSVGMTLCSIVVLRHTVMSTVAETSQPYKNSGASP